MLRHCESYRRSAYVNGPPSQPAAQMYPVLAKASSFPILAYLPGGSFRFGNISLLERGDLPVQVHVIIRFLLFGVAEDKFGFGAVKSDGAMSDLIFNFELFSDHLAPAPFSGIVPARRVPARLTSHRRQRLVREWIDDCVKNHPQCCKPLLGQEEDDLSQPWRPKRLLDLGNKPRNAIRLVDAAGTSSRYATLSHAWGKCVGSDLVLETGTLQRFTKERIRWRELPPAFQDAVILASEQNIRYIWIHALCVVRMTSET